MRIGTNIHALQAFNSLVVNNRKLHNTNLKMSTGYKVNSAADDPPAMSVISQLNIQISGYEKAQQNTSHAISLIQTADGALSTIHEMAQRMRELAVQSVNDTNSDEDRAKMQEEIQQLKNEINDTIQKTDYNGTRILSGDAMALIYKYTNSQNETNTTLRFGNTSLGGLPNQDLAGDITVYVKDLTTGTISSEVVSIYGTERTYGEILDWFRNASAFSITADDSGIEVTDPGSKYKLMVDGADFLLDALGLSELSGAKYERGLDVGINIITRPQDPRSPLSDEAYLENNSGAYSITDSNFSSIVNPDTTLAYGETSIFSNISTRSFVIQIGAQQNFEIDMSIDKISTTILGIDEINLTSAESATRAIKILDKSLSEISRIRANVGTYQNRLEFTINTLDSAKDTLSASYSRFMDTDMAIEMTEYTRQNITVQAAISVIAQANQRPAEILSLLRK